VEELDTLPHSWGQEMRLRRKAPFTPATPSLSVAATLAIDSPQNTSTQEQIARIFAAAFTVSVTSVTLSFPATLTDVSTYVSKALSFRMPLSFPSPLSFTGMFSSATFLSLHSATLLVAFTSTRSCLSPIQIAFSPAPSMPQDAQFYSELKLQFRFHFAFAIASETSLETVQEGKLADARGRNQRPCSRA
jgi:hypothetical protein